MTNRGTCTKCGRVMQVRADGLIRTHRDLTDNRCLGGGQAPKLTAAASGHMTHIDYTDVYAKVPGSDDGIGEWQPLSDDQRTGSECIDCTSWVNLQTIGRCDDGLIKVCVTCYERRLRDHIDYYRPQS